VNAIVFLANGDTDFRAFVNNPDLCTIATDTDDRTFAVNILDLRDIRTFNADHVSQSHNKQQWLHLFHPLQRLHRNFKESFEYVAISSSDTNSSAPNVDAIPFAPYVVVPPLPPSEPPPMLLSYSPFHSSQNKHEFVPSGFNNSPSLLLSSDSGSGGVFVPNGIDKPKGTSNPKQEERDKGRRIRYRTTDNNPDLRSSVVTVVGTKFTIEITRYLHIYMNQSNKSIRISGIESTTFSGMGIEPTTSDL
jgi:hypothetical protein